MTGDPPGWPNYGCQCPTAWWGIGAPPCPVHNPGWTTVGTTTLRFSMPGQPAAWECPRCQRINAPTATHCDCKPEVGP